VATIRITRYEVEQNRLPPVCMITGEPTQETKRHKFRWTPPWVNVLLLACVIPGLIAAMILRKQMTINIPVAERKRYHWLWRQLFSSFGVIGCIMLVVIGIVLSDRPNRQNQNFDLGLLTASAAGIGLLFVLIVSVILQYTSVRPKEITDQDITLVGVHEHFVEAMEEERDRESEFDDDEQRKPARRVQDEYDDDDD
jgi:NhaP-type Na+/H+ or K+/H+ antiporter